MIRVVNNLSPEKTDIVTAHEVGHMIDYMAKLKRTASTIPADGLHEELGPLYNTLQTSEGWKNTGLTTPKSQGYSPAEYGPEYMAEAIRAYMQNPNSLKAMAPETAKRIRQWVNTNPHLNK